ncbi:MAG: T9SS type A sorting domain-containing protein [Dysgonamonadaceae bacterium]|jgi:hypothetical protein|nr:T9SS type A sorting domain-containing protein [Dysgonamonadaceae bacterium]
MYKKIFFIALLSFFAGGIIAQTKVTVFKTDGAQTEWICSEYSVLDFEDENLVFYQDIRTYVNGFAIPRSEIRKLTFADLLAGVETVQATSLKIYPNPAQQYFMISDVEESMFNYEIFSLDGRKMIVGTSENGELIDICTLNSGVYLVKINCHTLKLVKQ